MALSILIVSPVVCCSCSRHFDPDGPLGQEMLHRSFEIGENRLNTKGEETTWRWHWARAIINIGLGRTGPNCPMAGSFATSPAWGWTAAAAGRESRPEWGSQARVRFTCFCGVPWACKFLRVSWYVSVRLFCLIPEASLWPLCNTKKQKQIHARAS